VIFDLIFKYLKKELVNEEDIYILDSLRLYGVIRLKDNK